MTQQTAPISLEAAQAAYKAADKALNAARLAESDEQDVSRLAIRAKHGPTPP